MSDSGKIEIDMSMMEPVVILETENGLRVVEFADGEWEKAHDLAQKEAMSGRGRAVVAIKIRQCGEYGFLKAHGRLG